MDIFKSIGEIHRNQANFKKWEIEQDKVDSKREALANKKPPSPQELENAKRLGKTLIGVVDVMDQHSEDVAESVETAAAIPMSLIPLGMFFGSLFVSSKFVINPADKKNRKIREEFFKENKNEFKNVIEKIKSELPDKQKYINVYDIINQNRIEKLKISGEVKQEALKLCKQYMKKTAPNSRMIIAGLVAPFVLQIGSFILGSAYATKMQVESSKVARYQARNTLKDPKYFVSYNPEQIEQAKKNLEKNPKKDYKSKLKSGMFKSISSVLRDTKEYKAWRKNYNSETQKITRPLSSQEIIEAQKDQEVIQRVIKKINNQAEIYSTNMEVAANVIMNGTPVLGGLVGWGLSIILNKLGAFEKIVDNLVEKNGDEEAKLAYQELKNTPKDSKNYKKLVSVFRFKMVTSSTEQGKSARGFEKITIEAKKVLTALMTTKAGRNKVLGVASAFVTSMVVSVLGMKMQKASARAGRYVAKRELEKNPQNFIGYSQQELDSTEAKPKQKPNKFKEYLMFLPKVVGQYFDYQKYAKTEHKEEKLLQEELVKLDVTDKQLKDAKNLQRKVFNTFEKVDDKSQDYSETIELVTETAQPFINLGGGFVMVAPLIAVAVQMFRGKISPQSIINKATNILSGSSKVIKSKLFKKYLNSISDNFSKVLAEFELKQKKMNLRKPSAEDVASAKAGFSKIINKLDNIDTKPLDNLEQQIKKMTKEDFELMRADIFDSIKNVKFIGDLDVSTIDKDYVLKMIPKLKKIIQNVPKDELKNVANSIFDEFMKNPENFADFIKNGEIKEVFITPVLKKAMVTAGLSWASLTLVTIYVIESIFANLQLKAGRLGVMKALDELKDPAYYASSEQTPNDSSNLISNLRK